VQVVASGRIERAFWSLSLPASFCQAVSFLLMLSEFLLGRLSCQLVCGLRSPGVEHGTWHIEVGLSRGGGEMGFDVEVCFLLMRVRTRFEEWCLLLLG